MIQKYESMVIVSSKLSDSQISDENEKLLNFLKDQGAEITDTTDMGMQRLAYPIQKSDKGYYFVNFFNLETSKIAKLENYYKINQDNIVRFNIIKK